jgi:hypothetical protein
MPKKPTKKVEAVTVKSVARKRGRFDGPPSDAARARVAKHLAGEAPLVLDPVEAAGSRAVSPQAGNFYRRKEAAAGAAKPPAAPKVAVRPKRR